MTDLELIAAIRERSERAADFAKATAQSGDVRKAFLAGARSAAKIAAHLLREARIFKPVKTKIDGQTVIRYQGE